MKEMAAQTCGNGASWGLFPRWKKLREKCGPCGNCQFGSEDWEQWKKGERVKIYVCTHHAILCHHFAMGVGWTW